MTYRTSCTWTVFSTILFTVLTIILLVLPAVADAQTATGTATFEVVKVIDPAGYTGSLSASDFSFTISGDDGVQTVANGDSIELAPGTYSITESAPGFNPAEWTVLWAGDLCGGHYPATQAGDLVVSQNDVDKNMPTNPYRCTAQNQFKPGTLKVIKEIVGTSTSYSDFSFTVNGGDPIQFDDSGINFVEIPAGAYNIVEVSADGYATDYSATCTGTIENHENITCTITNTFNGDDSGGGNGDDTKTGTIVVEKVVTNGSATATPFNFSPSWGADFALAGGENMSVELATGTYSVSEEIPSNWIQIGAECVHEDQGTSTPEAIVLGENEIVTCTFTNDENSSGGGNGDEDTYRIEGYVWHDNNENSEWDGFQDEEATTTEEAQSGWTVKITDGTTTHSTTTDSTGYYYFEVPAGTWTISEVVMDGWDIITPADNKHVVTVPATTTAQTLGERIFAFFVPTAHAAVLDTFGLFNFGNNESETVVTNGDGDSPSDGGGGSRRPRCTLLDISGSGVAYTLNWETRNGSQLSITQDGTEIFSTDDDDVVDAGDILVTTHDDIGIINIIVYSFHCIVYIYFKISLNLKV